MGLFDIFKRKAASTGTQRAIQTTWSNEGVRAEFLIPLDVELSDALLAAIEKADPEDALLGVYLSQLAIDGHCVADANGALITWESIYSLLGAAEHAGAVQFLGLPPPSPLRPILTSRGALSDEDFELDIQGWTDGVQEVNVERFEGAIAYVAEAPQMLGEAAWTLKRQVEDFRQRDEPKRHQHMQELAWGQMRKLVKACGGLYSSPYLETTVILTPDALRLPLTKVETPFGRVFSVAPTFEDAPEGWLTAFDGFNEVQPNYNLTRGKGRVNIVISEPVRQVLNVIKREMPGRRISGIKAEKFIHNPWAFLGDAAHEVLSEEDFTNDKAQAGSVAAVFNLVARYDESRINFVELTVTEHFGDHSASTDSKKFDSPEQLERFLIALRTGLEEERERFPWDEFDLSIDSESAIQLENGQQLVHLWRRQPAERIRLEDVYELAAYSGRIEGIGAAKPIYVPVFQRETKVDEDENGWLPTDLTPMVRVTLQGQEGQVLIPLTRTWVDDFESQVIEAERANVNEVTNTALPTAVPTSQARALVVGFRTMLGAQDKVKGDGQSKSKEKRPAKETLLVKTNFHEVDYREVRKASLQLPKGNESKLPRCLRPSISLKAHQLHGVSWFQHLVSKAPTECRGALLADDMGLGKTLQLLCLLATYYEGRPNASPSVIFAPKSLLENWENESKKFFTPSFPEVLVLYGDELKARKQPLGLIDSQLQTKGIVDLLKPGWVGTAKVIVTTYEVLTSYEFSFAKQPFAFAICDEAQRIKTPGTLVTLAAKKLKADFRIACTGTPVENSLADLWCLFDFVQPGLLGALEDFGKTYRRPIECNTEEQKEALVSLQSAIAPQTLRRTKADIAAELPQKFFGMRLRNETTLSFKSYLEADERLEISMADHQKILYKGGLKKLQDASLERDGRKRAQLSFGALHLMKAVCAEPYCLPGSKFLPDQQGVAAHLTNSPKLKWLLDRLHEVKERGEKAIVFTELREAQVALSYFLKEAFQLRPSVINGDSQGRQSVIDKFSTTNGFDVIILSTLAAGAGLNVTAANHVFHFTRAWNPAKESQATDRAYRIGQVRDVYVYCPTVVADDFSTFEERLDALLKRKAGLAGATLDDGGLTAMLNGSGSDASFTDFICEQDKGDLVPKRFLTLDDVDRLDGFGFEVFCALLWEKCGYQSSVTPKKGGDGGIDVVALLGDDGLLIQCKSSISRDVGWDAVKEVTAGAARYQARYSRIRFRRLAITNQKFNSSAIFQAQANHVELVDRSGIEEMMGANPISNHELDQALISWSIELRNVA